MSCPRLPPDDRYVPPRAFDANGFPDPGDEGSSDEDVDIPDDFDELTPIRLGAIETLLDADDDYEPAPEPGDFWIEPDAA